MHGYNFIDTPLWAGIYMLPLTAGFLIAGPISGTLSDKYGPRPFATAGLLVATCAFIGLIALPLVFPYWLFATIIFFNGVGSGLFASPNTSAIMSSVPASQRGSASGMRSTFQNAGMSLSIGIFFSLLIAGLASTLPPALIRGLTAQGVPLSVATKVGHLPPVSTVFAALLGYNPVQHLLKPSGVLSRLPAHNVATLTGRHFFPTLIAAPFHHGLVIVFTAAALMSFIGAMVSLLRGRQFIYDDAAAGGGLPQPARAAALPLPPPPGTPSRALTEPLPPPASPRIPRPRCRAPEARAAPTDPGLPPPPRSARADSAGLISAGHAALPAARPAAFTGAQHAFTSNQHGAASLFSPLAAAGAGGMHPARNATTAPWADVAAT